MGVFKNIRHGAAVTVCVGVMSIGLSAAAQASTAHAATAAYPSTQYGQVYSCTTGKYAQVKTTDSGYVWTYTGGGAAGTQYQDGIVYSYTTERTANVYSDDHGKNWLYVTNYVC